MKKANYIRHAFGWLERKLHNVVVSRSAMGVIKDPLSPLLLTRISKVMQDWFRSTKSRAQPWFSFSVSNTYNTNNIFGINLHGIPRAITSYRTKLVRYESENRLFPFCDMKCTALVVAFAFKIRSMLINSVFIQSLHTGLGRKTLSRSLYRNPFTESFKIRTLCGSFVLIIDYGIYYGGGYTITLTSAHFPTFTRSLPPGVLVMVVPTPSPVLLTITPILNESYPNRDIALSPKPVMNPDKLSAGLQKAAIIREYTYHVSYEFMTPRELQHVLSKLREASDIYYMYHHNNPDHSKRW